MRKTLHAGYVLLVVLNLFSAEANGASFSCTGKITPLETFICLDQGLSNLDSNLAGQYFTLLHGYKAGSSERSAIQNSQREFLRQRAAVCPIPMEDIDTAHSEHIVACLTRQYSSRIMALTKQAEDLKKSQDYATNISVPMLSNGIYLSGPQTASHNISSPETPVIVPSELPTNDTPAPNSNALPLPQFAANKMSGNQESMERIPEHGNNSLLYVLVAASLYYAYSRRGKKLKSGAAKSDDSGTTKKPVAFDEKEKIYDLTDIYKD